MADELGKAFVEVGFDPVSVAKLEAQTKAIGAQMERTLGASAATTGKRFGGAGGLLGLLGIGTLAYGLGKAIKSAGDFQQQLNVLGVIAHASGKQLAAVSKESIALGQDMRLPATTALTASEAITELVKSGLSLKDAMAAARPVLQLATGAQIDNAVAAKYAASVLNQFQLSGGHARQVVDLLTAATKHSVGTIDDFAASFRYAGSAAHGAGFSLASTAAALAELSNRGLLGSVAGTALAQALRQLQHPSVAAAEEMKKLGINVYDLHGRMKPLPDLISLFSGKLNNLTDKQKNLALNTLFTARSIQAARIVLTGGLPAYEKTAKLIDDTGIAARLARARTAGFAGSMNALQSNVETLGIQIGTVLLPAATRLVLGLANLTRVAQNDLPRAVRISTTALGTLRSVISALSPLLLGAGAAFVTLKLAMGGAAAATAAYGAVVKTVNTVQVLLTSGTTGLAAAQAAMGASTATLAAIQERSAVATQAAAAAQDELAVAIATNQTATKIAAYQTAALAAEQEAQAASAASAAAATDVLNVSMLATPWGLAAVGVAAIAGIGVVLYRLRGSTDGLKSVFDSAAESVRGLTGALNDERTAIDQLLHDNLDLRGTRIQLQNDLATQEELKAKSIASQRVVNDLAKKGEKNTHAYNVAVKDAAQAQRDYQAALIQTDQTQQTLREDNQRQIADMNKVGQKAEQAREQIRGFAQSMKNLEANARGAALAQARANSRFGQFATVADAAKGAAGRFAKGAADLSSKIADQIPKLQRQAAQAQAVAKNFGNSQSAAANAARAFAKMADGAVASAKKMETMVSVAGRLAAAIGSIPSQKTVDIFLTTHDSSGRRHRAAGGPVSAGVPYIVGEKRPELFVPESNGTIIPQVPSNVSTLNTGGPGVEVHVHNYFGNQEMNSLIDTRVDVKQRQTKRAYQAGRRAVA